MKAIPYFDRSVVMARLQRQCACEKASNGLAGALMLVALMSLSWPQPAEAQLAGAIRRAAAQRASQAVSRQAALQAEQAAARRIATRSVVRQQPNAPGCTAISNKCASLKREAAAQRILTDRYPGDRLQAEVTLLNRNGRPAIDPKTRTARRVDFVLFSRDGYTKRYEVTSQKARKAAQLAKEERIFGQQSNGRPRTDSVYVKDKTTGAMVPVKPGPSNVMRLL